MVALALLLRRRRESSEHPHPEAALLAGVAAIVTETRQAARAAARDMLSEHIPVGPVDRWTLLKDKARAKQIAQSHLQHVRAELAKAENPESEEAWSDALKATEWRAETIAATETFATADEELVTAAEEYETSARVELWKVWSAEANACDECADADGETVRITDSFSNGLEPGSAHPRCRCVTEIVDEPSSIAA